MKKPFFNVILKLLKNFDFSQFHEHIFRSSRTQIFFTIVALKNFAILRIKKMLQHRCFLVRSSHYEVFLTKVFFLQARTTGCHPRRTPILNGYTLPSRPKTRWESSEIARLVVLLFVVKQVRLKTGV